MPHFDYTLTLGQILQTLTLLCGVVFAVMRGMRTFDRLSTSVSNLTQTVATLSDRVETFGETMHAIDKRVAVVESKI